MSDDKERIDFDKNAELIGKIYSGSNKEQPPEELDLKLLKEAHQVTVTKKKYSLSTPWKAGLSMAAVLVMGLAVVLELGVVTQEKGAFEKPVIRKASEDQTIEEMVAPVEAPSGFSESNAAPMVMERQLKQRSLPSTTKTTAPEAKQQRFDMGAPLRNESSTEAEATKERRAPQRDAAQDLSSATTIKIKRPERWISEIQQLIEQGENQRAAQEIKKFKRYYPDVDLITLGIDVAPATESLGNNEP